LSSTIHCCTRLISISISLPSHPVIPSTDIPNDIAQQLIAFDAKKISDQRKIMDDENQGLAIMKAHFQFIQQGSTDKAFLQYVLCTIEGMLEGLFLIR